MLAEYGASLYARISSIMAIFLTITTTDAQVGASFLVEHIGMYQPLLVLICYLLHFAHCHYDYVVDEARIRAEAVICFKC
jgi:hypothetical protein